jgi:YggT family protein
MSPTTQAGYFALQFIFDILVFFFVLRVALRLSMASSRSPFVYGVAKLTNPACRPLARFIPYHPRWDFAALLWAFALQATYYGIISMIADKDYATTGLLMLTIGDLLSAFLNLWFITIIAEAILSFIRPVQFDPNLSFISDLNRPILQPLRRILPNMGGFDLSPILGLFIIKLSEIFIVGWLTTLAKNFI